MMSEKRKIILVGDEAVGKTALIKKFIDDKEELIDYRPTLGVEVTKTILKENKKGEKSVSLYFWDVAGQEMYAETRQIYYDGADGALIVFDCTRVRTFKHITDWYEEIVKYCKKRIPVLLVCNKQDLKDFIKVNKEEVEKTSEILNAKCVQTSALTGLNVNKMIKYILEIIDS